METYKEILLVIRIWEQMATSCGWYATEFIKSLLNYTKITKNVVIAKYGIFGFKENSVLIFIRSVGLNNKCSDLAYQKSCNIQLTKLINKNFNTYFIIFLT